MDVGPISLQIRIAGPYFPSLVPIEEGFFIAFACRRAEDSDDVPGQLFILPGIVKKAASGLVCQESREIADTCVLLAIEYLFKEKKAASSSPVPSPTVPGHGRL